MQILRNEFSPSLTIPNILIDTDATNTDTEVITARTQCLLSMKNYRFHHFVNETYNGPTSRGPHGQKAWFPSQALCYKCIIGFTINIIGQRACWLGYSLMSCIALLNLKEGDGASMSHELLFVCLTSVRPLVEVVYLHRLKDISTAGSMTWFW